MYLNGLGPWIELVYLENYDVLDCRAAEFFTTSDDLPEFC